MFEDLETLRNPRNPSDFETLKTFETFETLKFRPNPSPSLSHSGADSYHSAALLPAG
jgi:hypothetical protein